MQKNRPVGVTILAYWALAGSGAMFAMSTIYFANYSGVIIDTITIFLGPLAVPLGGAYAINGYAAMPVAVFFAIVGLHTLQGRKWAWFANVGMSIAAFAQYAILLSLFLYNTLQTGNEGMVFGLTGSTLIVSQIGTFSAYGAVTALRLFYLLRPHVCDFFGTRSLFVQKHAV